MNKINKNIPVLRFAEFLDSGAWESDIVGNLINTVTPPKKLKSNLYDKVGTFPIIDQSQSFICGWTNDSEAIIKNELPLVIFGDHTCVLKYISKPFAQGADGIKIIKPKDCLNEYFFFQFLSFSPIKMESYKRHFSTLKQKKILYPSKKIGEQKKIADCLSTLDEQITSENEQITALQAHKKGLMQQLFPNAENINISPDNANVGTGHALSLQKNIPARRFPEFLDSGEWDEEELDSLAFISSGGTPKRSESIYWNGDIPWVTTSLIDFNQITKADEFITQEGLNNSSAKLFDVDTLLMAMYGQGKTRGKVSILKVKATTNQACSAITFKKKIVPIFAFYDLSKRYLDIRKISNEGGQKNLSGAIIKKILLKYPLLPEQQKIADCLASLDDLITAQRDKIDALKLHKKGLMQGLFPSVGNV